MNPLIVKRAISKTLTGNFTTLNKDIAERNLTMNFSNFYFKCTSNTCITFGTFMLILCLHIRADCWNGLFLNWNDFIFVVPFGKFDG